MNADFAAIPGEYDRAANLEYPGGISTLSHDGADQFWMGLRASFPDAQFKIHHQIGREDPFMPPRAASDGLYMANMLVGVVLVPQLVLMFLFLAQHM